MIQTQKYLFFHKWVNNLLSSEHCLKLERWQGPPHKKETGLTSFDFPNKNYSGLGIQDLNHLNGPKIGEKKLSGSPSWFKQLISGRLFLYLI